MIKTDVLTCHWNLVCGGHYYIHQFIDSIQNILSTINQSKIYDLMLYGDFNIDLLNKDCNNSTLFLNTMYSLSFLPNISRPTRITDNSATLIDNLFINEPCNFESGILNFRYFR